MCDDNWVVSAQSVGIGGRRPPFSFEHHIQNDAAESDESRLRAPHTHKVQPRAAPRHAIECSVPIRSVQQQCCSSVLLRAL